MHVETACKADVRKFAGVALLCLGLAACSTTKKALEPSVQRQPVVQVEDARAKKLSLVQKVSDNSLYQTDIVTKINFTVRTADKELSCPGKLSMRKDEVIRLQLQVPLLGTELGRLEFTPDYVLILDRLHKQYVKAAYNQLSFLHENGISFYSLQALFWNQLLLPGKQAVKESDLSAFDVELSQNATYPVTYKQGNMTYRWTIENLSNRILKALIAYDSTKNGNTGLTWEYTEFKAMGSKMFPNKQTFTIRTNAVKGQKEATVVIDMDRPTNEKGWEARTSIPMRYEEVKAGDILKILLSL